MAYLMYTEMREQPEAMARAVRESAGAVRDLVAAAKARDVHYVVLAARAPVAFVDPALPDDGDLSRPAQVFVPEADYDRAYKLFYAEREDEL